MGISKKDFSQANKLGYGPWATAEDRNTISRKLEPYVEDFCQALVKPPPVAPLRRHRRRARGPAAHDHGAGAQPLPRLAHGRVSAITDRPIIWDVAEQLKVLLE